AVADFDVPDAVGAGQRAVHAVERCGLRCPDVGPHVLHRVIAQGEQLSVTRERGFYTCAPRRRKGTAGQVLEAVLDPAHRHAELAGGKADEDDVDVDRRLDTEAAARVLRRDYAQLGSRQTERGGSDGVE